MQATAEHISKINVFAGLETLDKLNLPPHTQLHRCLIVTGVIAKRADEGGIAHKLPNLRSSVSGILVRLGVRRTYDLLPSRYKITAPEPWRPWRLGGFLIGNLLAGRE